MKLAIECDEFGHKNYDQSKEIEREKYIKNKIGCHFIRFNPNNPQFNIGDVIYKINQYINKQKYKNKIKEMVK
ncbi:hypothetical protein TAF16_2683 [Anoxybacillus flavithermus]|uniref:DUF559 domain-containing protein n=1 Tax=Anoxybacillus flavithermus TaxID=33934 RepID=A0A178T4B7_9BACL|nr:hypothetical protein TAF16_2683 [Anoxybacillus flavithermus]